MKSRCWNTNSRATGLRASHGAARFLDPHTIEIVSEAGEVRKVSAERFILAVGAEPHRPANIPFDGEAIVDADEILDLKRVPRSLAVIGASA